MKKYIHIMCAILVLCALAGCAQGAVSDRYALSTMAQLTAAVGNMYLYPDLSAYPDIGLYLPTYTYVTQEAAEGAPIVGYEVDLSIDSRYVNWYGGARLRGVRAEREAASDAERVNAVTGGVLHKLSEGSLDVGGYRVACTMYGAEQAPAAEGEEAPSAGHQTTLPMTDEFYAMAEVDGIRYSLHLLRLYPYATQEDCAAVATAYFTSLLGIGAAQDEAPAEPEQAAEATPAPPAPNSAAGEPVVPRFTVFATDDGKRGVWAADGNTVVEAKYAQWSTLGEGIFNGCVTDEAGSIEYYEIIDLNGDEAVTTPERAGYGMIWEFSGGLAPALMRSENEEEDGKWCFIDKSGAVVLPAVYDDANSFAGDWAFVSQDGTDIMIDREGNTVLTIGKSFTEGEYMVLSPGGFAGLAYEYEYTDEFVVVYMYEGDQAEEIHPGVMNRAGEMVVEPGKYIDIYHAPGDDFFQARENWEGDSYDTLYFEDLRKRTTGAQEDTQEDAEEETQAA